jgi:hypothetical protein
VPAAFGGSSGLLWADALMATAGPGEILTVSRAPAWWIAAAVLGMCYVIFVGRGIQFSH